MRASRYFLLLLVSASLFIPGGYAQTDYPYINPPVPYDYSGDSDQTNDSVYLFTPDSEAVYIKVIGFNPPGTETHRIEIWNPTGELYFSEDFGASTGGWTGYFGDYQIESRMPIKNTDAADMNGRWDVIVYLQTGSGIAGPESYSDKRVAIDSFYISIRELGRREILVDAVTFDQVVATGEAVNVDVKLDWIFDTATDAKPSIIDAQSGAVVEEKGDTLSGDGSKTISFSFAAPMEAGTYDYVVEVPYMLNGEWYLDPQADYSFQITVEETETGDIDTGDDDTSEGDTDGGETGFIEQLEQLGIPGFPSLAVLLGLAIFALMLSPGHKDSYKLGIPNACA